MTAIPISPKLRAGATAALLCVLLSACGTTNWGFPYRAGVQQGNWITSEQVAQLQKGMTREQVRFILGTPTLQDVFHSDRWDYPYFNKPGYGDMQERKFTVWFTGDTLDHWGGDPQPDRQPFQKADTGMQDPATAKAAAKKAADKEKAAAGKNTAAQTGAGETTGTATGSTGTKDTGRTVRLNPPPSQVPGAVGASPDRTPQPLR